MNDGYGGGTIVSFTVIQQLSEIAYKKKSGKLVKNAQICVMWRGRGPVLTAGGRCVLIWLVG